jgi:hypothetical protein
MIVVGARFRALAAARAALNAVRGAVSVAPGDAGVRPLGSTGYEAPADAFVVAGRFEDGDEVKVVQLLHAHGGRIIERRVDSPRARPLAAPEPPAWPAAARTKTPRPPSRLRLRAMDETTSSRLHKRLRRPSPPLRVRTARSHRIER